jgi:hypothetical protein
MNPSICVKARTAIIGLFVGLSGCDNGKIASTDSKPVVAAQVQPTAMPARATAAPMTAESAPNPAPTVPAPAPNSVASVVNASPAPAAGTLADRLNGIDNYSYAQKSDLITRVDALSAELDTVISAARGEPPRTPKPEALDAHTTAFQNLDDARLALTQRRDALQYATTETWESARNDYRAAWQTALAALAKVRSTGR